MVDGSVMKPKTTSERNTMTRPKRNDAVINVTRPDGVRAVARLVERQLDIEVGAN